MHGGVTRPSSQANNMCALASPCTELRFHSCAIHKHVRLSKRVLTSADSAPQVHLPGCAATLSLLLIALPPPCWVPWF